MIRGSKLDELLTLLFMLLAITTVICFFIPSVEKSITLTIGGIAIGVRIRQYILRFFN